MSSEKTYNNDKKKIQTLIAEASFKIDDFASAIQDACDAIETYRGMENIDNEKCIRDYEKSNIPYFRNQKNDVFSFIRNILGEIQ